MGVIPYGTIGIQPVLYEDLYVATANATFSYIGFFTLDLSGATAKLTYTPSSAAGSAPVAAFTGTLTSGMAPLQVVFTNTSSGSFTNSVWNFGDGHSQPNTTGNVTHIYTAAGSYTVSLTVNGSGGSNTKTLTNYIVASAASNPKFGSTVLLGGKFMLSGTGGAAGAQYRIFTTTNVALPFASWIPVTTNTFLSDGSFAWTNATINAAGYFRLVSP